MDFPLPEINLRDISKLTGELPDSVEGDEIRNLFDRAIDKISRNRSSSNLVIVNTPRATSPIGVSEKPLDLAPNTIEPANSTGDAGFTETTAFLPSPSPKISPSSIPNPNPSVTVTKQLENTYPSYNNYLFSIPGYSAFQPVAYQAATNNVKPSETANQSTSTDFIHFPNKNLKTIDLSTKTAKKETNTEKSSDTVANTDFENKFTTEIITSISTPQGIESKLNITSLRQGSGATVTIPSQIDIKKKTERFSLMTSIPISKIDMKCVNPSDNLNQNNVPKKPRPFNPAFQSLKPDARVEIQSNVIIKGASNSMDESSNSTNTNNINSLINAAEIINKNDTAFWNLDTNDDIQIDAKDLSKVNSSANPTFGPIHHDTKINFIKKPPDGGKSETKNQIVFLQNQTNNNPKMLVTLTQQQNDSQPQSVSQKTTDSKNLEAPSRLSIVNKKCKEELIKENGSSKVVSLKRLHHENCDEDDFENLITENQIYGNKIVVKERSQGTLQEQEIKPTTKQTPGKNMVLQPNFLYVSNVQFPANVMMIKNNNTINQNITEQLISSNRIDNKFNTANIINTNDTRQIYTKATNNIVVSKDMHVLKSNNSVLQTLAGKQNKQDVIFQTNQNMIMNPQIIYQVPMLVESDSQKLGSTYINQSYSKFVTQKKEIIMEPQTKQNEKLYIACPYQMDSKLQPKILITNIRPKVSKVNEVSTLDIYELRNKMRMRLKQNNSRTNLINCDPKKMEKQVVYKNIITADNMKDEMCKEFAKTKIIYEDSISDSESDYERDELNDYADVIKEYSVKEPIKEDLETKKKFLSIFKLGTLDDLKEKNLEKHERIIQRDSVAMACIAAGRLDKLLTEQIHHQKHKTKSPRKPEPFQEYEIESSIKNLQEKRAFLANLQLATVTRQYKKDYEWVWQQIVNERRRRNGLKTKSDIHKAKAKHSSINSNDQLKLLSDIKHLVTENNNLIKRRLDAETNKTGCDEKSICEMAEKSFSELTRLSKMADKNMQILSGKDTRKRDLNPGFDSERIQKPVPVVTGSVEPLNQSQCTINIPNISKILSLRTDQEDSNIVTTQAPSMEEPSNCAAYTLKYRAYNHIEIVENKNRFSNDRSEANEMVWPGIDPIKASFRTFDAARKKQILDVERRNTQLRVSCALSNRTAKREAKLYRTLNAERRALEQQGESVRLALSRLFSIVNTVRQYQ